MRRIDHTASERRSQTSGLLPLAVTWSFAGIGLLVVAFQTAVPVEVLLLDPVAVGGGQWYGGLITSLGILAWTVAVCACLATAFLARLGVRRRAAAAFQRAGLVFGFLLLDDLFLLHSGLIPSLTGIPKIGVVAIEGAVVSAWILSALPELRRTRWPVLAASFCAFGVSIAADVVLASEAGRSLLIEDGAKFLAVVALATWATLTSIDVTRSLFEEAARGREEPREATGVGHRSAESVKATAV